MSDTITVTGLVATVPHHLVTGSGLAVTSFRLASTQRRYDRKEQKWVDAETNWYTIATFRQLATNVVGSLQKGQRIIVTGRLRVRDWATDDKKGTNVEIDAEALGHDLSWGTAAFTRSAATVVADDEHAIEQADGEQSSPVDPEAVAGHGAGDDDDDGEPTGAAPVQEAVVASTPF